MNSTLSAVIAANRFGLGARPGDLASIAADGRGWLTAQLGGAPPLLADAGLRSSVDILADALRLRREIQQARNSAVADDAQNAVQQRLPQFLKPIYVSEATARLAAAVASERPFLERLTQFWTNHFAVSVDKQFLGGPRRQLRARGHPAARARQLQRAAARGRDAPGDAPVSGQLPVRRSALASRATARAPRRAAQDRHQRESGARDPRAAYARRRRRLYADRRHDFRRGHHRLVDRRRRRALRGRASPGGSCSVPRCTSRARK